MRKRSLNRRKILFSLLRTFSKTINLTDGWICVALPVTANQGFQLLGTPLPKTANWHRYWQEELTELSKITIQNRMALDRILASQGTGGCTILNASCCTYAGRTGEPVAAGRKIWEVRSTVQQIQKDGTSWGFSETFSWFTLWFPNWTTWMKKALLIISAPVLVLVCLFLIVQCSIACCSRIISRCQEEMWKHK